MSDSSHPSAARLRECEAFHHIPFEPVPVKARHDGWTPARQRGFIDRLVLCGCVARAAKAVGKSPQSAYRLREHPGAASFSAAWDRALADGQSYTLDLAFERSLLGQSYPVIRNGRVVRECVRYDNGLTIAALNAMNRRAARKAATEK